MKASKTGHLSATFEVIFGTPDSFCAHGARAETLDTPGFPVFSPFAEGTFDGLGTLALAALMLD